MKLKHIINEVSVDVIRTAEIRKLLKEYDALDGVLLESNDTRDVKIVVRLDELGLFDSILERQSSKEVLRRKREAALETEKRRLRDTYKAQGVPDDIAQRGIDKDLVNFGKTLDKSRQIDAISSRNARTAGASPSAPRFRTKNEPTGKPTQDTSEPDRREGGDETLARIAGSPEMAKLNVAQLGKMIVSAGKAGGQKARSIVGKLKAVINNKLGKPANAPLKDVPGIPPEAVKIAADTPSPEASTDTIEPSAEAPTTDSPVTDEPSADTTPSGDEAPTDTPSIEEPSAFLLPCFINGT
jgi:hypothetical protein